MAGDSFKVFWTRTAYQDIEDIIDYISLDSPNTAREIFTRIRTKSATLINLPHRGRIVPELKFYNIITYRELIAAPWRIIYRVEHDTVYVMSVIDGKRNIEDLLLARLIRE
ncbi:MAG: type II toxin-antitoxin system RelE/ParE family toxin [Spirochaetes bacterium]|nr:MAG: type II toxin-antitoxin system RelE/ParE family toxin [Spirochaetota bacterium]